VSSEADSFICGDPSPHTFRDSKGEEWTLMPDCVGRGAFSEVYKAFSSDGIIMAVKCIQLARRDVRASDVVDEVNTSCQLWNEHIVNCTSWARVGTYLFIVMELLAGGSLHDTLRHFPHGLSNTVARRYGSDVLRGLSYLHRHGIVHADVKPQNMLLATDGGCRISDFGSSVTQLSGVVVFSKDVHQLRGTPLYMSPEVACGEPPTVKSDVWSFGLSLYEMLTGHLPWVWQSTGRLVYPSQEEQRDSISSSFRPPFAQQQRQLQQHLLQPASPPPPLCSGNGTLCLPPLSVHSSGAEEAAHAARQAHSLPQMCSPPPSAIAQVSLNAQGASLSPTAVAVSPVKAPTAPGFLQSVIRGDIVARVDRREFTSQDAIQVVEACLRGNPAERPTIDELLFMTFFSTLR
jgi:serine/threonine protein kinase